MNRPPSQFTFLTAYKDVACYECTVQLVGVRHILYAPWFLRLHSLDRSKQSIFRYRRHTEFCGHTAQQRQLQLQRLPVAAAAAVKAVEAVLEVTAALAADTVEGTRGEDQYRNSFRKLRTGLPETMVTAVGNQLY